MKKILIIEDEKDLLKLLKYNFEKEGYKTVTASDGEAGLEAFKREKPDLVILDIMLPELNGYEFLKIVRRDSGVPVVVLTARKEEVDKILGFELGADDFVTKPFSVREVLARVKTILKRIEAPARYQIHGRMGDLEVDFDRFEVRIKGRPVSLSTKEFDFLKILIEADGKVLSREKILENVWGYDQSMEIDTRTIDQHISRLREKLGHESERIVTVKNKGYRIKLD